MDGTQEVEGREQVKKEKCRDFNYHSLKEKRKEGGRYRHPAVHQI